MCAHTVNVHEVHRHALRRSIAEHLRACVAYIYITVVSYVSLPIKYQTTQVPSIASHLTRIRLYICGANVALKAACLPQASCFVLMQ